MNELTTINTLKGELTITEFSGHSEPFLQLTQGLAGSIIGQPGDLGAIHLSMGEVAIIIPLLVGWMKDESRRRAEKLRQQIAEDKALEKTVFSEAAECERFIREFQVPALCVSMLARIKS